MIPAIALAIAGPGIAVCLYIMIRCSQIIESDSGGGTKVLAAFTGVVAVCAVGLTIVAIVSVFGAAAELDRTLQGIGP